MRRAFFEATVARTHTLLSHARWVARSSVGSQVARRLPGRHSLVAARPLRCRSGLSVGRRGSGRPPPWCPQVVFCPQGVDTSLEQCVGRLNHDRTTERHWQGLGSHRATVPKGVPCGSSTPTPAHATSPRATAVRSSPVPFHLGGRPNWSGGLTLSPLPPRTASRWHRRIAPTAQDRRRCARRQGLVRPRDPSGCPVTPSFGGPPAAGRQRVFSWEASSRVVKSHLGSPDVVCHCGGTGDRGLFAPQSSCPRSSRRQGSHLPYTSVGLLRRQPVRRNP